MTGQLAAYRKLERRLWMARWTHEGQESPEEDLILDEMDSAWLALTSDEQEILRLEGPRCWPTDSPSTQPPTLAERRSNSEDPTPWSYQGFSSPGEAILSSSEEEAA